MIPPFRPRLLSVLLLAACAGAGDDDVAPTDAEASEDVSRGDACRSVAEAGCDWLLTCNRTFTDRELCAGYGVDDCCGDDGTCDEVLAGAEAAGFEACEADLDDLACDAQTPPESCDATRAVDF